MRPFVLVNVAVSADGKLSTRERKQVKISGTDDFDRVDTIKSGADAIMVGIGTVLADNPSLTVKSPERIGDRLSLGRPEHPIRVVVDSKGRTPPDAKILHKGPGRRIIAVSGEAPDERLNLLKPFADIITTGDTEVDLHILLERLGEQGIGRLMVEGGGTLIAALFRSGLVDQLSMFIGNIIIGGGEAPTLADGYGLIKEDEFTKLELISVQPIDEGVLINWKVKK
ncbi:MAG: 2,5-diamino-6-(ribosylamino)-4(3H)-pyrimidinone 5'-phosphate reductase [Methanobacteriota archaeon]